MENHKVLYSGRIFDVVEIDGIEGVKSKRMTVAVMPYTIDENGLIDKAGFLIEYNPFRHGEFAETIITGTVENEDENLLNTVIRELEEEGGITIPLDQIERIIFLGTTYPSKDSDKMIPIFAVDVTNLDLEKPEGDGSEKESRSEFKMIPISETMTTNESLPLVTFLRLFNYIYQKSNQLQTNVQS